MTKKIILLVLCSLLRALGAEAQQPGKVYRIGLLQTSSSEVTFIDAFRQGLRELGYVEGKHFTLEARSGETNRDRLATLAAELVRLKVDIIVVAGGTAIRAVKEATGTIPIVIRAGSDPVKSGLVASLARPGGNITGLASINLGLVGKRLELLLEVVPGIKRVAALSAQPDPARFKATDEYQEMEAAARTVDVKLKILWAPSSTAIDNAFSAITKERPEALIVIPSPRYLQDRERIVKHAAKNRIPSIYPHSLFVQDGGLISYGADFADEYRRLATYVDKILKGTRPADLPVEQPKKFELIINLKTAKQIGLTIPPNVLARADKVIR